MMFYKYVCILCLLKKMVYYWLLSPEIDCTHGGPVGALWRRGANTAFCGFLSCGLFFLLRLNFLGNAEIILVV